MPRAATTSDVFNALAEPRRREILSFLAGAEKPVNDIVFALRTDQPSVSKHLSVLREVGLVRVRRVGRHRMYRANADGIRPLYDFAKTFEKYWAHQLLSVKERAEAKERNTGGKL
jgi:DNA-binding transcriptional ArsR family regulator